MGDGLARRGDGLVVVGAGNGRHDLLLVEVLRPGDHRDEADELTVEHDLRLEAGRAVAVPDRLATARDTDAYAELVDPSLFHMGVYSALAQLVDDVLRLVLVHECDATRRRRAGDRAVQRTPRRRAIATASVRPPAPSLARMLDT